MSWMASFVHTLIRNSQNRSQLGLAKRVNAQHVA